MEQLKVKLVGKMVTLEPLELLHTRELIEAGGDSSIWNWMTFSLAESKNVEMFVKNVCLMAEQGRATAYVIRSNDNGAVIGGSGYWHVDFKNKKLEIGGSWITAARQRTGANTEAKYLLLRHAFEKMNFSRVGFSIDSRNKKSLRAIERIGATKEGTIRKDMVLHDGRSRDSTIYSILVDDWSDVKVHIEALLSEHANAK